MEVISNKIIKIYEISVQKVNIIVKKDNSFLHLCVNLRKVCIWVNKLYLI